MRYEFKVGDKGWTERGEHYEVVAIVPGNKLSVVASVGPEGHKQIYGVTQDGSRYGDGQPSYLDLMPPEPESRDCYLWVADDDTCMLVNDLDRVHSLDGLVGPTKAIKPITIKDGEGLGLLEAWRDERAKKSAPEPLWPGRVVYDLRCVRNASRTEKWLKNGRMSGFCGLSWSGTPQGCEWWAKHSRGSLSSETRAALEDLLAQYRFENGERYEITKNLDAERYWIVESLIDHERLIEAFEWKVTPEGRDYWDGIDDNGHDWQSRVKLKVMLLSIAAHDAASSDRDALGDGK